jgi:hypothetical protein
VTCAHRAYRELRAWLATRPAGLHEAVRRGASRRFYLWINDYSQASEAFPHPVRESRLWYWERTPPVRGRVPGFWKWEATLTLDGRCRTPDPAQIDRYLDERLRAPVGR